MVTESSGSVPDEHGESDLREDDGVVTTGVGTGLVTTGTCCVGGMSGVFFLSCFSGFSGLAGFGGLTGFSSLSAFTLPLRKQTVIIRNLKVVYKLTRIVHYSLSEAFCNILFAIFASKAERVMRTRVGQLSIMQDAV